LVNVARREHIDAESALRATCAKFRRRWEFMEDAARRSGRSIADVPNAEQEALWAQAKLEEKDL
jgi:tetrapyrrole methylase family protein/MazG family protein